MSWIKRRPLLALGALALSLRVAAAVVTEYNPIFPAYYYTDARLFHEAAVSALREEAQGRPPVFTGTLNTRVQASLVYELYRWTGPRPLAIKLVNAALGAAGVVVLTWVFGLAFSRRAALAAGLLVAIWPTHVFYTSQNLKEAPADFLAYAGLACALAAGRPSCARRDAFAALAVLAMVGAGFYRPQVLEALSAALLVALSLTALRDRRVHALAALGAVAASLALCAWTSRLAGADADYQLTSLSSPSGITDFRKAHQSDDRRKALALSNREIATQIFPDVEFRTWGGVASYLPKGAFYVLFMPLPGLYPMAGKIGRLAAAGENTVLLLVAALAVLGIIRGPKTPIRLGLLVFFAVMTAGAALLEFDLGSAGRHKLLYLPMLFPFAAEEALRLLGCPQETPS